MDDVFKKRNKNLRSGNRLIRSIAQHPALFVGMVFYWLWINMGFQIPIVFCPIAFESNIIIPSQAGPLLASIISYLIISFSFKRTRKTITQDSFLWVICITMSLASVLIVFWLNFAMVSLDAQNAITLNPLVPAELSILLYALGCILFGASSSCLCIEMQRLYGSLGSQYVLLHGPVATLASVLIIFLVSFTPPYIQQVVFILAPLPIAYCLLQSRKSFSKKELFLRGENTELIIPKKLLVTSFLHGLSLGILLAYPVIQSGDTALLVCAVISYTLAAILLLVTAVFAKFNFNTLIYQIGFPVIAVGLYLSIVISDFPLAGVAVQFIGFGFLHLVMWGVCSYFIKNFDVPSNWVIGISTGFFMTGQFIGAITSGLLSQAPNQADWLIRVCATVIIIILSASLFMMSNRNLRTGWGLAKPDVAAQNYERGREFAVKLTASESNLTNRETSILKLLSRGKNRKTISSELYVSNETVKTHIQNIYKKIGVHSQQELLQVLDEQEQQNR